jgi:hypothetical protein
MSCAIAPPLMAWHHTENGMLPVFCSSGPREGKQDRRKPNGLRQDFAMSHGLASFRGMEMTLTRQTGAIYTRKAELCQTRASLIRNSKSAEASLHCVQGKL